MTLGRLVRRGFGAILVLALAASVYTFAQSSSTPPSSGPVDPGVRTGPPSVGGSLSGLTADETAFFQDGRARFADIEVVTGGECAVYGPDAITGVVNFIMKEDFEGAEARVVTQPRWEGKVMSGADYFLEHGVPNFFFHLTHAYAILRHNGVGLGKMNYIGSLTLRDV